MFAIVSQLLGLHTKPQCPFCCSAAPTGAASECADGNILRGLGERHAEREGEAGDPKSDGWNEAVGNKGSNKT